MKNLGRTLLDECSMSWKIYFGHTGPTGLGVSDGLLQVLGHIIRLKTEREFQVPQFQGPEHHVCTPVHELFVYINHSIALTTRNQPLCI
jgi:hypothetical protein